MEVNSYRPDIDGLRGIAVVSVILFHLSIPGFAAGLVGVDIFFVISGFVITRLLLSGFSDGTITLTGFYERRIRRLAPALVVTLIGSFVASYVWLLPTDFSQFTKSLLATTLGVSNLFFARQTGDYFAPDAATKPLLHTWSLAVEEQFYLLFSAGLLFLLRRGAARRTVSLVFAGSAIVSLGLACVGGALFPAHAFFMLPTRAWELMLGALVAQSSATASPVSSHILSMVGATFIACGIVGVRLVSSDVVPQPLLACLGTAIMIYANSGANTLCKAALSNSTLVRVGLISYSLYLWHWPTMVFYRYAISDTLGASDVAIILAITTIASIVTWVYVEQPVRKRRVFGRPLLVFSAAVTTSICLVVVSVLGIATEGLSARLPLPVVQLAAGRDDVNPRRGQCINKEPENVLNGNFCRLGRDNTTTPSFMVWGDSQADPWMPVFQGLATQSGGAGLFAAHGGCPPLLGIRRVDQTPSHRCMEFNDAVFAAISRLHLKNVVLIGRWSWYIYGVEKGGLEDGPGAIIARVDEDVRNAAEIPSRKEVFSLALAETAGRLHHIGAQVWVIDQPPTYAFDVPKYLAYSALRGAPLTGRTRADVRQQHAFQLDVFRANNVNLIDTSEYLCPTEELFCRMQIDGRSIYSDYNHLSTFGAREVAKWAKSSLLQLQ
jgi:peptidoglycan/LPS O-acetylase OafA/YrhL